MRVHAALREIERSCTTNGVLLDPEISLCDVFLAMLYAWHNKWPDLPNCTRIARLVATHPVIAPVWDPNFSHRWMRNGKTRGGYPVLRKRCSRRSATPSNFGAVALLPKPPCHSETTSKCPRALSKSSLRDRLHSDRALLSVSMHAQTHSGTKERSII